MNKLMKFSSLSVGLFVATLSLVGCSQSPNESINFFNYGANIDDETLNTFEKEYGIRVNMATFDDMETMYQKIASGGVKYDVILVSDALMPRMIDENLLQELNQTNLPNLTQMDEAYLDLNMDPGNVYSVPYMFGTVGLVYDKNVITEPVDSWDILWNPAY
ncbi:MAG: ABC transporter substrate-binding protein, partial [Cellulosilyticaceae bacterium]